MIGGTSYMYGEYIDGRNKERTRQRVGLTNKALNKQLVHHNFMNLHHGVVHFLFLSLYLLD